MERVRRLLTSAAPVKWLFDGDSITHGALHTFGDRDYTELFSERVRCELSRYQDIVIKSAISGNTTQDLLATFDWRIAQFRPHVVFLMIGMNDCSDTRKVNRTQFTENLHTLVERIQALEAIPVLQTTCPILPGTSPDREPHFPAYMDAIRAVAAEHRLPLVDHTRHWEENKDKHYFWMNNAFHPNGYGHRAFAMTLLRALGIFDPQSFTGRLLIP